MELDIMNSAHTKGERKNAQVLVVEEKYKFISDKLVKISKSK